MADLQIKITEDNLDIFLQGGDTFVFNIFCDIRKNGLGQLNNIHIATKSPVHQDDFDGSFTPSYSNDEQPLSSSASSALKESTSAEYSSATEETVSAIGLEDFIADKNPTTYVQKTTVFVYYLSIILKKDDVNLEHITHCYHKMNYKIPANLQQNLVDICGSKYGYIKKEQGHYRMTDTGKHFVEDILPKKS